MAVRSNAELYNADRITIPTGQNYAAFTVIGDKRNWNFFCATEATADDVGEKEIRSKNRRGHSRRRGPSDSAPTNVTQSSVNYLVDPSLKSGNALPGIGFILKTTPNADIQEQRKFQLVGNSRDLIMYLDGNVNKETYIYLENGARHTAKLALAEG